MLAKVPPEFYNKISKDEINLMPVRGWEGEVELVRDHDALQRAIAVLRQEEVLGFDTETKPSFKKGVSHRPALLQLAGADKVYLFHLHHLPDLAPLSEFLADLAMLKVGVGMEFDIKQLREQFDLAFEGFLDVGELARRAGAKCHGLRSMAACFFGFRISKRAQCSNWAAPHLQPYQIRYAATDAWVSREIYFFMKKHGIAE